MKHLLYLLITLTLTVAAQAGTYRVHYSLHSSGRDITVLARSSDEARREVQELTGGLVSGVRRLAP